MFLPTTQNEMRALRWGRPDIILVTGSAYIDHPADGTAMVGNYLAAKGFRVAVISQPDIDSPDDITRLGTPKLFWGISAGSFDSMVANYTALKKRRRFDDSSPGGENRRPDRAVIKYSNLVRRYFKSDVPIIIGGVEASLRRIAHYDYWSDSVRRSIIFDARADGLIYGSGERTALQIAEKIRAGVNWRDTDGICTIENVAPEAYVELPDFESVRDDKRKYAEMFAKFYGANDPYLKIGLIQKTGDKYLVVRPPQMPPSTEELDSYYDTGFLRKPHPSCAAKGEIRAFETIRTSISSHRGCFGECNFCSIAVHQGRRIVSRSEESVMREVRQIVSEEGFGGYISDVGGASANMYGASCRANKNKSLCSDKRCTFPNVCKALDFGHDKQIDLLKKIRAVPGVKKVFIGSGIRYDLIIADRKNGGRYLEELVAYHVSGQLKIAPEHVSARTLSAMGKNTTYLTEFKKRFDDANRRLGKKQYLTYYLMAAHPDCDESDTRILCEFLRKELKINPEQVQIFTPTPLTVSSTMYHTGLDPFTLSKVSVEKDPAGKLRQKESITGKSDFPGRDKSVRSKSESNRKPMPKPDRRRM